jgi:methyl-accepting chemotaxis protein
MKRVKKDWATSMSISQQLKVSYNVLVVLTVVVAVIGIIGIGILHASLTSFINGADLADDAIKNCRLDINIAARSVREMALNDDVSTYPDYISKIEENLTDTGTQLTNLKNAGVLDEDERLQYVEDLTNWANDAYAIAQTIEAGDRETGIEMIFSVCEPALTDLGYMSEDLMTELDAAVDAAVWKSQLTFIIATVAVVLIALLAGIVATIIRKSVIKTITTPLNELEMSASELSHGNLHFEIEYTADNEFGRLAEGMRNSVETLGLYVDRISNAMSEFASGDFTANNDIDWRGDFIAIHQSVLMFEEKMAETITGIKDVAKQVESDANQVATEQASIMQEFTATVDTVYQQVVANAEYADNISKQVESVGQEISTTSEKMQSMVNSMAEINESSQKIHKIIDTINDVADQTNLLALNASIEAARAGEAGKGFAVVANQVTALAAQTAEAAKESTALIEASMREVENGMSITDEIAQQQEKVATDAQSIVTEVSNIADNLKAQDESFNQLNTGITQINGVIQTNSATSQQCAASSQEMSSQANALTNLIGTFQVKDVE